MNQFANMQNMGATATTNVHAVGHSTRHMQRHGNVQKACEYCGACNKKGHWQKVCQSSRRDRQRSKSSDGARFKLARARRTEQVHTVEQNPDPDTGQLRSDFQHMSFDSIKITIGMTTSKVDLGN